MTGSRSCPVISATALTWPVFSAMSAMTAGRTRRIAATLKLGVCHPTTSLPSAATRVRAGKPSQAASATAEVSQRRCSVAWVAPPSTEVIGPTVASSSHDSAVPKMRARKTAMRLMNPRKATAATIVKSIVASATHWSCGQ